MKTHQAEIVWIAVKDQPPPPRQAIIARSTRGYIHENWLDDYGDWNFTSLDYENGDLPSHWLDPETVNWIKTTEQLPPKKQKVIARSEKGVIHGNALDESGNWDLGCLENGDRPIAWFPKPKMPNKSKAK